MAFTAPCTLSSPAPGQSLTDQAIRLGLASHATVVGGSSGISSRGGIIPTAAASSPLSVSQIPTPSMNVRVQPGTCIVPSTVANGGVYSVTLETQSDIQVNAAHATNPRIDVLVAAVFSDGSSASADLRWVQGTAAASPTRPSLTPPTGYHYLPLAQVTVQASASSIVTANITLTSADGQFTAAPGGMVRVPNLSAAAGLPVGNPFFDVEDGLPGVINPAGTPELFGGALLRVISQDVTTDVNGDATLQFKQRISGTLQTRNFPNGFLVASIQDHTPIASLNAPFWVKVNGGTAAGVNIRVWRQDGPIASGVGPIRLGGIALGY